MELWFILAVVSLIFSGLLVFIQKVGVMQNYNSNLLNGFISGIAGFITLSIAIFIWGYSEISWLMFGLALAAGIIYLFSTNLRMDSFRYIDTTIALPVHKFFSPLFVLLLGVILFKEHLTALELLGIILGVLVPLLLINKVENGRQQNLKQGLLLITLSALLSGIGAAIYKLVADLFYAVLLFAGIANIILAFTSAFLHKNQKVNTTKTKTRSLDKNFIRLVIVGGIIQTISFSTLIFSFAYGGSLAVVYTITSLYILIPIILSIIFYNEHWNKRKVVAIILSILAVGLMG